MTSLTPFIDILAPLKDLDNDEIFVPADWGNGTTIFGGLTAAMAFQAARRLVPSERTARAVHATFVGALTAGEKAYVCAHILREGGAVTHVEAKLWQNEAVVLSLLAVFGKPRRATFSLNETQPMPQQVIPHEQGMQWPYVEGMMPAFLQNIHIRWTCPNPVFSGKGGENIYGWARLASPPGDLMEAWILTLSDAWPSPIMSHFKLGEGMAQSLGWSLEFPNPLPPCKEDDWYYFDVQADMAAQGYGFHNARLWHNNGTLVTLSRQSVVVKEFNKQANE